MIRGLTEALKRWHWWAEVTSGEADLAGKLEEFTEEDQAKVIEAARQFDLLTTPCPTCEGDPHKIDRWTCSDCGGRGEVPNQEAVVVMGKAFFDADDSYRLPWHHVEEGTRQWYREKAKAALVGLLEWTNAQT